MTAPEVLKEARRLIAEKGWTQSAYHRDADGVTRSSETAASFCIEGACMRAIGPKPWCDWRSPLAEAIGLRDRLELANWNDRPERTKEEILAAFDRAIEIASSPQMGGE